MGHPLDPDGVSGSNHVSLSSTSFPFSSASSFSILSLSLHSPPSPSFLPPLPPPPPSLFPPFPPFPPFLQVTISSFHSLSTPSFLTIRRQRHNPDGVSVGGT